MKKIILSYLAISSLILGCNKDVETPINTTNTSTSTNTNQQNNNTNNNSTTTTNNNEIDGFVTRKVISNLDVPWEILWGEDNTIWTTERNGTVSRIDPNTRNKTEILKIPNVFVSGEAGLLGMVFHPDFKNSPYVYLAYTYRTNTILERIVRYTYDGKNLVSPRILLDEIPGNTTHIGARLLILPDKTLLITTGDAQNQPSSQDKNALTGKILRMNLDGSIPQDNPFPNSYTYSFGHRNAQGLLLHPNGILYSSEHGPDSDDELNIIEKAKNYGWPNVKGTIDENEKAFATQNNVVASILNWTPTIATSDLAWYNKDKLPKFKNKMLMAVLKNAVLYAFTFSEDGKSVIKQEQFFAGKFGRIRDVLVAPDGRVFLATNGANWSNTDGGTHQIIEISEQK